MDYIITQARMLAPAIKEITVRHAQAQPPAVLPGAHFKWLIPGIDEWRHFSTVQLPGSDPMALTFAIRLSEHTPSSAYIRSLNVGDQVELDGPFNGFAYPTAAHPGRDIVVAGGIGITPLMGITQHLLTLGRTVHLHYFARSEAEAAYADHVRQLLGERARFHYSQAARGRAVLDEVLADLTPDDQLFVCGPAPLLAAILEHAQYVGLARERVHFEVFGVVSSNEERGFIVDAADSGVSITVMEDQTLLQALEAAGLEPLFDCRRGECGVCELDVLDGEVDHRDFVMTPAQAACSGKIYPCVSRAAGQRLKLAI